MTELFENFEVNRDARWIVLLRLVGASLVLHLTLLGMVVYVPAVRDTVNLAALIASTKFVDKDYEATQIGDGVQLVQVAKFRYPDGYFAVEGQGSAATAPDPFAPKIISQAQRGGGVEPEASPSPSPEPSASPLASPSASASSSAAVAQASPANSSSTPLTPEEAQKQLEETAKENNLSLPDENQINRKPLKDFAAYANELKKQGKLDLDKPFEMVLVAELDDKGKLQNVRPLKKSGDENLNALFGRMVAALNDSGLLIYLQPMSKDNPGSTVTITIKQGDKDVLASIESEASSAASAERLAKGFNGLLFLGARTRQGKDEAIIMENTNATPDGKKVVVNFTMPRQSVVDLIKKQMEPGV
jgi:Ni,Fe-hydrogenase III component G